MQYTLSSRPVSLLWEEAPRLQRLVPLKGISFVTRQIVEAMNRRQEQEHPSGLPGGHHLVRDRHVRPQGPPGQPLLTPCSDISEDLPSGLFFALTLAQLIDKCKPSAPIKHI